MGRPRTAISGKASVAGSAAGAGTGAARRGRPAARVYDVEEVADLLGVSEAWVERALRADVEGFLPGAFKDVGDGTWRVPARALRHVLGEGLPRLLPVAEFARLVGLGVSWVYELMDLGVIPERRILGKRRIPATAYWQLPAHRPPEVPARPSFFYEAGKECEDL